MLIGNGALAHRFVGAFRGNAAHAQDQIAWAKHSDANAAMTTGGLSKVFGGLPSGYRHPGAFLLPLSNGALASRISADGSLTATIIPARNMDAALDGLGDITSANLGLIVSLVAALTGDGTVSVASIVGVIAAASDLSGAGSVSASLGALAGMVGALSGSGDASGSPNAYGAMSADILSFGDLTPENIARTIMGYVVERFGASEIDLLSAIRLMLSESAGKVSGAGTATETFRSAIDHKDRIVATVDASGNRTSITLDTDD